MKYRNPIRKTKEVRARMLALLVVLTLPLLVSAGGKIVSTEEHSETSGNALVRGTRYNAQTLALLGTNPNLLSSRGGGGVEIVDVSALKSTQGPEASGDEQFANRSGNVSLYTVREGDSIGLIAQMFNVSSNTIIWANNIPNSTIQPGDTLVILPMSGVRHKVKEGDTLNSIAKKYNGDPEEIRNFNDIERDEALVAGAYVTIPDGEVRETVSKPQGTSVASAGGNGYFIRPLAGVEGKNWWRTQGIHGYNGVDLAAPEGTPIIAAASGTVVTAKADGAWNGGYGNYVIIKHPSGVQTLSAHFGSVLVGSGQEVVQGQTLGYIGLTGKTTGPHVHFEVRGANNPF